MFPAFWFAGEPIGMDVKKVAKSIWRFFVASAGAGCLTAALLKIAPVYGIGTKGAVSAAFVRLISTSLVFFTLYLGAVIALYKGLKPLDENLDILRDLLPNRMGRRQRTSEKEELGSHLADFPMVPTISDSKAIDRQ